MTYLDMHRDEIFKKYDKEEIIRDINNYKKGSGKLQKTLNNFFEECIFESCGKKTKISPMECLKDENNMVVILNYIKSKPNFFTSDSEVANVKSCLRNSMSWVRKVANFCPKNARDIYFRYFDINGKRLNILDTSSGFGSRMSAVLLSGHNYCGFDPNPNLFKQLKNYLCFLRENDLIEKDQKCALYKTGSETYRNELESLFDVSFTSPPYFNLEKYANDDSSSTKNYDNYSNWIEYFAKPTIENTYRYLKVGGYAMINIKNINKKETCFDDWFNTFKSIKGFEFLEIFDMEISKKQYGMVYNNEKGEIENKEPIMVFRKVK